MEWKVNEDLKIWPFMSQDLVVNLFKDTNISAAELNVTFEHKPVEKLFSLCKSCMLTWLGLLGRCLHMSMFALAHELSLSPLQIHVNLVLNPAFCYIRVPGSPSPSPHQGLLTLQLGWSPAQHCWVPVWGGQVQVLIFHKQAGEHGMGSITSPLLHTPSSASQAISGVASFPDTCFPWWNPLLLESSDFVIIPASTKSKFLAVQMRYTKKWEHDPLQLKTLDIISHSNVICKVFRTQL